MALTDLLAAAAANDDLRPYLAHMQASQGQLSARWRDHTLTSAFQPILSFSHSRIIGHEGLVRVADPAGHTMAPPDLFVRAEAAHELPLVDRLCRMLHAANAGDSAGWLFLNVHPSLFSSGMLADSGKFIGAAEKLLGRPAHRWMLEVVEEAVQDLALLDEGVAHLRAFGVGIALDDFGAGHSNFDRVWRIRPDIVKLDRSFALHVSAEKSARRLLPRLVSLLHEAGTLVLLEGVETLDQALIAMDSDIDFAQGWFFARATPQPQDDDGAMRDKFGCIWDQHAVRRENEQQAHRSLLAPYLNAVGYASVLLSTGIPAHAAAAGFIALPHAACFYLLDKSGQQVGPNLNAPVGQGHSVLRTLGEQPGARWSLRPYFRRALEHPGKPQVTRPYISMATGRPAVTVSSHVLIHGEDHVLCGDIDWQSLSSDYPA